MMRKDDQTSASAPKHRARPFRFRRSMHDFGYPCFMPREVTIDGLYVDDSNHPEGYQGMVLFSDPDGGKDIKPEDRPFPYCSTGI